MAGQFWYTRSAYWGEGVWIAHEFGRDLGRTSRCTNDEACGCSGWHGWRDSLPNSGGPEANQADVTGASNRDEVSAQLSKIWKERRSGSA
jgi:hypothetical protein